MDRAPTAAAVARVRDDPGRQAPLTPRARPDNQHTHADRAAPQDRAPRPPAGSPVPHTERRRPPQAAGPPPEQPRQQAGKSFCAPFAFIGNRPTWVFAAQRRNAVSILFSPFAHPGFPGIARSTWLAGISSVHRKPSGAKSIPTVAWSALVTIWSMTNRPKPLRSAGLTVGPTRSRHSSRKPSGMLAPPVNFN